MYYVRVYFILVSFDFLFCVFSCFFIFFYLWKLLREVRISPYFVFIFVKRKDVGVKSQKRFLGVGSMNVIGCNNDRSTRKELRGDN